MHVGKRLAAVRAKVDKDIIYTPLAAIKLSQELSTAKFDETV